MVDAVRKALNFSGLQKDYAGQFAVLWIVGMLAYAGFGLAYPQFSILITSQGFTLQQFGLIQGLATFLSISSQVSIGKLSDRLDKRKPILAGALLLSIPVTVIFPHARSLSLFVALLAVNQLATSLFNATAANWVTRYGSEGQLGRLHGVYRISFSVGWIVATAFMGKSLDLWGVEATFYLGAAMIAAALGLTVLLTRDVASAEASVVHEADEAAAHFQWPLQLKVILAALGIFTLAQTMGMHLNYIFFREEMQVTNQQFGMLSSVQSWPEIPLMLALGIASDRVSSTALVAGGMLLAGLRWLLMSVVRGITPLYFIQPLHAIGMTITEVVIIAVISRQVPRRFLGTVMGWQVTVLSAARLLAPLLAGVVGEHFGIRVVFLISALVSTAAGLLIAYSAAGANKRGQI